MADSPRVTELRREIAEMEANRGHLDPAMTDMLLASLREDLAEALGQATAAPARPLATGGLLAPAPPVLMGATVHQPIPIKPIPAAPAAPEVAMPKKLNPKEKLQHLMQRLAQARTDCKNPYRHKLQHQIRALCLVEGWPVPPEAEKVTPEGKSAIAKAAHPKYRKPSTEQGSGTVDCITMLHGRTATSRVSARVRAMRSMALDLLPELEELTVEASRQVEAELGLLTEALALAGKILQAGAA